MEKTEVLDRINPLVEGEVVNVRDANGIRVNASPDGTTLRPRKGMRLLEVTPEGVKSIVNFSGVPLKLARQLTGATFSSVLSEVLAETGKYSLIVKDEQVTQMLPYGAREAVNPEKLLGILEKIVPGTEYNRCMVSSKDASVFLEVIGEKQDAVARGDLVRAGVSLMFSPMGSIHPSVQSFAVRLECTNGMTSNHVLNTFGRGGGGGDGDDIWQFFRGSIKRAYRSFAKLISDYRKLHGENVSDSERARILASLIQRARLNPEIAEAVMAMAVERPPRNAWDLHNLITYASSHMLTEPRQVHNAQKAAAEFADETTHSLSCPLCHRSN